MRSGFPDDEETRQYRRLCQAVRSGPCDLSPQEVYREAADRIEVLRDLAWGYTGRNEKELRNLRWWWWSIGVWTVAVLELITYCARGL